MTIYQVWDYDPMASSMGADYIAKTFLSYRDATAEVARRNAAWRASWVQTCGEARAEAEPWNWRHARVETHQVY